MQSTDRRGEAVRSNDLRSIGGFQVCQAYAHARNPSKSWKQKDLKCLREYVINELPALLDGIVYNGHACTLMFHPTLSTGNASRNGQRDAMTNLLEHMREKYRSSSSDMCHIFDVDVPLALLTGGFAPLSDCASSTSSLSDDGSASQPEPEGSFQVNVDSSGFLWLGLSLQLLLLIVSRVWLPMSLAAMIAYGLWSLYRFLLQQMSKRGQWSSESSEHGGQVSGTEYQSFFGDLPAIQASQNGRFLNDVHKRLDRPDVYRIWMGPEPALMLAHPRAVKEFWSQHDESSVERNVHLGWPLQMLMGHGVGFLSMKDRNRITKFFHRAFGQNQVQRFDSELETLVTEFFRCHTSDRIQSQDIKYLAHDAAVPSIPRPCRHGPHH